MESDEVSGDGPDNSLQHTTDVQTKIMNEPCEDPVSVKAPVIMDNGQGDGLIDSTGNNDGNLNTEVNGDSPEKSVEREENQSADSNLEPNEDINLEPSVESNQEPDENLNQELNEESNQESNIDPNTEFKEESNQELKEESNQELTEESNQELNGESNQELNEESNQELNEESNLELNEESNQELSEESNQELNGESNQELNEESNQEPKEESNQELNEESNQELNEESNLELNEESNQELNEESNPELNEESNQELNEESNQELNEESNLELNEESNQELNEESNLELNEESNQELNEESNQELSDDKEPHEQLNQESNEESNQATKEDYNTGEDGVDAGPISQEVEDEETPMDTSSPMEVLDTERPEAVIEPTAEQDIEEDMEIGSVENDDASEPTTQQNEVTPQSITSVVDEETGKQEQPLLEPVGPPLQAVDDEGYDDVDNDTPIKPDETPTKTDEENEVETTNTEGEKTITPEADDQSEITSDNQETEKAEENKLLENTDIITENPEDNPTTCEKLTTESSDSKEEPNDVDNQDMDVKEESNEPTEEKDLTREQEDALLDECTKPNESQSEGISEKTDQPEKSTEMDQSEPGKEDDQSEHSTKEINQPEPEREVEKSGQTATKMDQSEPGKEKEKEKEAEMSLKISSVSGSSIQDANTPVPTNDPPRPADTPYPTPVETSTPSITPTSSIKLEPKEPEKEEKTLLTETVASNIKQEKLPEKPDIKPTIDTTPAAQTESQKKASKFHKCIVCSKAPCECPPSSSQLQGETSPARPPPPQLLMSLALEPRRKSQRGHKNMLNYLDDPDEFVDSNEDLDDEDYSPGDVYKPERMLSTGKRKRGRPPLSNTVAAQLAEHRGRQRKSFRHRKLSAKAIASTQQNSMPLISNVVSLAAEDAPTKAPASKIIIKKPITVPQIQQTVVVQPPPPKQVKNKSLLCKPFTMTKATSCRPHTQTKEAQTVEDINPKLLVIPVPVPIYVPVPMAMYNHPVPFPLPIPIPVPVPQFIPTSKKNADSILKHVKEIQERMPADPFEAEILMMAEAVATEGKADSDSDTEVDEPTPAPPIKEASTFQDTNSPTVAAAAVNTNDQTSNNALLSEDMLQMALRMTEMTEPMMDLETTLEPASINPEVEQPAYTNIPAPVQQPEIIAPPSPPKKPTRKRGGPGRGRGRGKRQRVSAPIEDRQEMIPQQQEVVQPQEPPPPPPDADMRLKYTYGVNAWKHWVLQKNAQLERASKSSRVKMFKTDILGCTADELNYSLCLFVKEVRKPNGEEYAPDSIYYLCLGIQQYLYESGRIDNLFADFYYEKFAESLNEIVSRYEVKLNHQGLIVCRIEEDHLWECKQLGAHSPHVLLNTLVYFNTKSFLLKTPEEHLKLSFSHIMKHMKKTNMPGGKTPGRMVYLRYYAPLANGRPTNPGADKKRMVKEDQPVFEQCENADNPLRCPVKLYEFYLSKCPESIKNRNDVFYLTPERSCVPDSPVWYSTIPLVAEPMVKMINRVKLVREIQEAHLHYQPIYG